MRIMGDYLEEVDTDNESSEDPDLDMDGTTPCHILEDSDEDLEVSDSEISESDTY